MEKVTYVLRGDAAGGEGRYRELLVDQLAPQLIDSGRVSGLTVCVDDEQSDVASPVPAPAGQQSVVGVVGVEVCCHDRCEPLDREVADLGLEWASYLVSGAVFTDYGENDWAPARSWPDGDRSPGLLTVSLFTSRPELDRAEFLRRWHGTQSPLSEAIQPRQRYVRNEVIRALSPDAPLLDGIVEEAWAGPEIVSDPMAFFCGDGDPETMNRNIEAMLDSVNAFIDMETMANVTMSEYLWSDPASFAEGGGGRASRGRPLA